MMFSNVVQQPHGPKSSVAAKVFEQKVERAPCLAARGVSRHDNHMREQPILSC